MIDVVVCRKGDKLIPFSEHDRQQMLTMSSVSLLRARITGAKKERSYRELCCYFGSCDYIADLNLNENMNTKNKADYLTRIRCGFVKEVVIDENGLLHWIPDDLDYENCDHPKSHKFIQEALERHAFLAGVDDVDEYVRNLNKL